MKYKVTHTTAYNYESPVRVCHNLVMLSPRNDGPVRVQKHHLKISPRPQVMHAREDFFGNQMHAFSVEESHRQLKVTSVSRLRVLQHKPVKAEETRPWESIVEAISSGTDPRWISAAPFQFDSRKIQRSDTFREYALMDFTPGRPILLCALELMNRIHTEFKYDPAATFVNTLPHEVFAIKRGVCQDFAQVGISALRSIGLSARYVSGYLRTVPPEGKERLIGADQSMRGLVFTVDLKRAGSIWIPQTIAYAPPTISQSLGVETIKMSSLCVAFSSAVGSTLCQSALMLCQSSKV